MESMDPAVLVTVTLPCYKDHLALDPWIAPPHGAGMGIIKWPPPRKKYEKSEIMLVLGDMCHSNSQDLTCRMTCMLSGLDV